ncbi:uncharacterized protein [Miscanthus floridulus]|uniref:uncharacterized protein n=1 Tax=Miscanthus floridulus TaxID=154761 RepID=UPI0034592853
MRKILTREGLEKRRQQQRQDGLPLEASPSPSLSTDASDGDDEGEVGWGPLDHLPDIGEMVPGASASSPTLPGGGGGGDASRPAIAGPRAEADTPEEQALGKHTVSPQKRPTEVPTLAPLKALKVSPSSTAHWVAEAQAAIQCGTTSARANPKEPVAEGGAAKVTPTQTGEGAPPPHEAEDHESDGAGAPSVAEATEVEPPRASEAKATEVAAPRTAEAVAAGAEAPRTTEATMVEAEAPRTTEADVITAKP